MFAFALAAATHAAAVEPVAVRLRVNQMCAGSPLVIGSPIEGRPIQEIHVLASPDGRRVGWIYATGPRSFVQAHARMSDDDQRALHVRAASAVSELRLKPASLPDDLTVRPCRPAEIATY